MIKNYKRISRAMLFMIVAGVLAGCAGEDISHDLLEPRRSGGGPGFPAGGIDLSAYTYVLAAGDRDGNVSFFGDNGIDLVEPIMSPDDPEFPLTVSLVNDYGEPYGLGNIVHAHDSYGSHWLFVVLSSGVLDDVGESIGGGVAMIDMDTLQLSQVIPLRSDLTAMPSRPGQAVVSSDGMSLWITNTGPQDDPLTPDFNEGEGDDSVFVLPIDDPLSVTEVLAGDGPRTGAFARHAEGAPESNNWFVALNGAAHTLTVFDYTDPYGPYQVGEVVDLNAHLPPKADGTQPKRNFPAGAVYSPVSGKIYIGIAQGADVAVATIDAKMDSGDTPVVDVDTFKSTKAGGVIPTAGYIATSADGRWVFTSGWLKGATPEESQGYLSVIDAAIDEVVDVVSLGNLASSSFNIVEDGISIRVYLAGADRKVKQDELPGILNSQAAMVAFDPESGMHMPNDLGEDVTYIEVGKGDNRRDMAMTTYGEHLFVPGGNSRECQEIVDGLVDSGGNGCSRVTVIDTASNAELTSFDTIGMAPMWLSVFEVESAGETDAPEEPGEDGAGGGHHH